MSYLFTSESVSEGHPDKVADQISDGILDNFLAFDPNSRVAIETLVTTGQVILSGEVSSSAYIDVQNIARDIENQLVFPNNYFYSLLVNLYTNKGLDLHSDDEAIYMYNNGIVGAVATISLGETAVATIARNDRSKYFKIKLTDGSCYVMPEGDFQNKYKLSLIHI